MQGKIQLLRSGISVGNYQWSNEQLLKKGKLVVGDDQEFVTFVVVDRLTKYTNFVPMSHLFTARGVAQIFLDNIYKLHGFPSTIVSDRDPIFMMTFW